MVIVVGLGNPGKTYEHTYHNIGFDVVQLVAEKLGVEIKKNKFKALIGEGVCDGEKFLLAKPQTFMNNSGECLRELRAKFKDARILVVVDDIDLPRGTIRYREHGSAGTHNGLRSIVANIGQDFERVKVGVGRDVTMDLVDFVLSKYDCDLFSDTISAAADKVLEVAFPNFLKNKN